MISSALVSEPTKMHSLLIYPTFRGFSEIWEVVIFLVIKQGSAFCTNPLNT